jgi:tRNA1Val (adenine37-N6)-methyltransferase
MKINTDGVLLAALAGVEHKTEMLDIGTGTGVIALMLAQRNEVACIDALEIDAEAAKTAALNFTNSVFNNRLKAHQQSFQDYFKNEPRKHYDLIVSNPPFFINALKSNQEKKNLARHTSEIFFEDLISLSAAHLTANGLLEIIIPTEIEKLVLAIAVKNQLFLQQKISISSFDNTKAIRCILSFGKNDVPYREIFFTIYAQQGVHSAAYKNALKDFFTIF